MTMLNSIIADPYIFVNLPGMGATLFQVYERG